MPHAQRIAADRERFLEGAGGPLAVRPEIAASWRRSVMSGVTPDRAPMVPVEDLCESDSRLVRAAGPVLDRLAGELSGTVTSIIVTDAQARILARRVGERSLGSSLDRVMAVPGACYGEDVVGTNGLGTAIELRRPTMVAGSEHFHEMLQQFTCVGAPLIHPVTGRLEGVLDLTCRYEDTNELMLPVVLEAARDITRGLRDLASVTERLLLDRFIEATRRSARAVIVLNGEVIITNPAAARLLEPSDHALLWTCAEEAIDAGRPAQEVVLHGGTAVCARLTPIVAGSAVLGALVELDANRGCREGRGAARRKPHAALPGLVGASPEWRQVCEAARRYAACDAGVAVLGPPGAGKLAVARALHRLDEAAAGATELDAAAVPADGTASWLSRLRSAVAAPGTVIIRHADLLPPETARAVASVVEAADARCRLVATAGDGWPGAAPRALVDRFPARIVLPPLARRAGDIPALLAAASERLGVRVRWTAGAVHALSRCSWPGNVRELEALVRVTVARRRAGDVGVEDLPVEYRSAPPRRSLTALEQLERDAIVRALAVAGGNKHEAAVALGISRSTLYRKLAAYRIDLDTPSS